MIELHRLHNPAEAFFLNDDLIVTVESTPDTVITLVNDDKLLVAEKPAQVVELVREWRESISAGASLAVG